MKAPRRLVGIVDQSTTGWTGGGSFTRSLAFSLAAAAGEDVDVALITRNGGDARALPSRVPVVPLVPPTYRRGEIRLRRLLKMPLRSDLWDFADRKGFSILLPLQDVPVRNRTTRAIGWIPDFQHRALPQYFSDDELVRRDVLFRRLAEECEAVMLSSHAAFEDFKAFVGVHADKAFVAPFPSLIAFEPLLASPEEVRTRLGLASRFVLVANQLWAHKNHLLVIRAVGDLARHGIRIPVVMTGMPVDYRQPNNKTVTDILQAINAENLWGQVVLLGQVEHDDLLAMMRLAAVVVQPSRFEGWSTVVQDAKALGRPLLCSDLAVHREQAPDALGFFGCDDVSGLAQLLATVWPALPAGVDHAREMEGLAAARQLAVDHGHTLLRRIDRLLSV